jgi:tetratricopeptide (TPR) repeat protein
VFLGLAPLVIILFGLDPTPPGSLPPMKPVRSALSSAVVACALVAGVALEACGGGDEAPPTASGLSRGAAAPGAAGKSGGDARSGARGARGTASALVAYQTALQLLLKGDPERAVSEFQRAVELDPTMSEAFFELGKLQVHLSSQNVGSQARDLDILDQGLAALEKARDLEPSNDHYWFWVGKTHYLRDDAEKAMAGMKKAVELNPKHFLAWKMLGRVQKDSAQMEEARASFEKAIQNAPNEAGTYFQLGQTLEALSDLAGARTAYEKSVALDPTEPEAFGRLMQVCARLGDAACEENARAGMEGWMEYDRKLQRRRGAVNKNPGDPLALQRLGEMYFAVGKWEEALGWFLKSLHIDPTNGLTHLYCGIVRRHLRDYVDSMNHLKEAEFLAPDNLDPKLELLRLYAETEDDAGAEELVSEVETAASEHGESLWSLAEVCQEVGRAEDAARLFGKARALGVTSAPELQEEPAPAEGQ